MKLVSPNWTAVVYTMRQVVDSLLQEQLLVLRIEPVIDLYRQASRLGKLPRDLRITSLGYKGEAWLIAMYVDFGNKVSVPVTYLGDRTTRSPIVPSTLISHRQLIARRKQC